MDFETAVAKPTPFDTAGSLRSGRLLLKLAGGFSDPFCHRAMGLDSGCLSKDTLDGGGRNAMASCDLADALATLTVLLDSGIVHR